MSLTKPSDLQELKEVIQKARANKEHQGFNVTTGGTKAALGAPSCTTTNLNLAAFSGVRFYEPAEMAIGLKAATPLAEVENLLATQGQRLAFEPPKLTSWGSKASTNSPDQASVAGMVAAGFSGSARIARGGVKDHLLGLEFLSGRGENVKSGGRVMKNVTGYDMCKLFTGSWGTLGLMTDLVLKTQPMVEIEVTLILSCANLNQAGHLMRRAMMTPFDVLSATALPLNGLDALGAGPGFSDKAPNPNGASAVCLRLEGLSMSVDYRRDALLKTLTESEIPFVLSHNLSKTASSVFWSKLSALEIFETWDNRADMGKLLRKTHDLWRISLQTSQGPELVQAWLDQQSKTEQDPSPFLLDWAGGLVWLMAPQEAGFADWFKAYRLAHKVRGHFSLFRQADESSKQSLDHQRHRPWRDLSKAEKRLSLGLMKVFDPEGLFNPGRMGLPQ